MLLFSSTVLLLLSCGVVSPVVSQCTGGVPGIPGTHGPDGPDGPKGEKGDPGDSAQPIKGQKGALGLPGPPGRPGLKGDAGMPGPPGLLGPQGEKGRPFIGGNSLSVFFSYKWAGSQTPTTDTNMEFNREIQPDLDQQFRGKTLANGAFVCSTTGVYFFSYHVSAKSRLCLKLMKGSNSVLTTCDSADGFLVTSGSAVMELSAGDTVSLQTHRYSSVVTSTGSTGHTFTGFLLFPTA